MKPSTHPFVLVALAVILLLVSSFALPTQFGAPPTRRAATTPVTIPAEITSYGGVFLQTHINGSRPLSFCLDSGASAPFFIAADQAKLLGLKLQSLALRAGGAGPNSYEVAETRGVRISLGDLTFKDQAAAVISLALIDEQLGRSVDGLVGLNFFLRYVVEIDYADHKLRIYEPEKYTYSGAGESIPLTLQDGHFFVPAKIRVPGRPMFNGQFLVDTGGCMMTVVLTTPFARSNRLPARNQKTILDRSVAGLGGETKLQIIRASSFALGSSVIREPITYISQDNGGALASSQYDGIIGSEILRRFKVIFDYARRRLILERNVHYDDAIEYDMSGMSVRAYGSDFRTFRVQQVLDGSPAASAAVRVGDILVGIDSVSSSQLTLEQILQMLKLPGRSYSLTIKRDNKTLSINLKTRRLL